MAAWAEEWATSDQPIKAAVKLGCGLGGPFADPGHISYS